MSKKGEIAVKGSFPPELVEFLNSDDVILGEEVQKALEVALQDQKTRTRIFLAAWSKVKINNLIALMERLPKIEEIVFDAERLKLARIGDVVRLLVAIHSIMGEGEKFLEKYGGVSSEQQGVVPVNVNVLGGDVALVQQSPELASLPAKSKEKLARIMSRLLNVTLENVKRAEAEESKPDGQ